MIIEKQELLDLLRDRLWGQVPDQDIRQLVEDAAGRAKEWEEIDFASDTMGYTLSVECSDICALAEAISKGEEIRFFKKKVMAYADSRS